MQLNKYKRIGIILQASFLFCLSFFLFTSNALASVTHPAIVDGQYITIPAYTGNSKLICVIDQFSGNYEWARTLYLDSVAFTDYQAQSWAISAKWSQVWYSKTEYLNNPPVGTYSLNGGNNSFDTVSTRECVFVTNVIADVGVQQGMVYLNGSPDNLLISLLLHNNSGENVMTSDWTYENDVNNNPNVQLGFSWAYKTIGGSIETPNWTPTSSLDNYFIELQVEPDTPPTPPACTSFTYSDWSECGDVAVNVGEGLHQERSITSTSPDGCSIDYINNPYADLYRSCTIPTLGTGTYLKFTDSKTYCRINMSCSVPYIFDSSIFGTASTGHVYSYTTSEADRIDLGVVNLNTQGLLGIFGKGNLVASSDTAMATPTYYEIVPHSDILDKDYAVVRTEVYFLDEAAFAVAFDDPWNESHIIPTDLKVDMNPHDMACTPQQWAAADSVEWFHFNVERIICNTKQWTLEVGLSPMQKLIAVATNARDSIMGMFPFSLMSKTQTDWNQSMQQLNFNPFHPIAAFAADGEFNSNTAVYSGDFSITAADLFGDKKGTTTIPLISKNTMESLIGVDGFGIFNTICRLLVWTAFFAYCWDLVTNRLHKELTN